MLGTMRSSKSLAYRSVVWLVIAMVMIGATGCGDTPTPTAEIPPQPTGPTPTATLVPTSTPLPTATPTEIPIILPTATPPNPILPQTQPFYQPAITQGPTYTPIPTTSPIPTSTPVPSATPYAPPVVTGLGVYSVPGNRVGWYRLDNIPPPSFSTQCILAAYFSPQPSLSPDAVLPNQYQINPADPVPQPFDAWLTSFQTRWFNDARKLALRIPAPTFTPIPTNTPIPTATPLPYPTPDVFTGLTPIPPQTPTSTPVPTVTPVPTKGPAVPTWTPSLQQRFTSQGFDTLRSVFISDANALLPGFGSRPTNFVVMWQVMNDMTLALFNPDTPIEVYMRAYEQQMTQFITTVLGRSLADARLNPTGEQRYANRKIIIGNVPDLSAFRYFNPCFSQERLRTLQTQYNSLLNQIAARYPGKVYIADMTSIDWKHNPQWVTVLNGYELTTFGADAVADVFGHVFERILPTL